MDDATEKSLLKMLLDLIPKDVPKDYVPYSEGKAMDNCNHNFSEPLVDQVPPLVDCHLNGDALNLELNQDPGRLFPENIAMLPVISPMEIDLTGSEGSSEKLLPTDNKDTALDDHETVAQATNPVDTKYCNKTLQVKCLQDMESLQQQCEVSGIKFNASSECGVRQVNNCDPSNRNLKQVQVECLSSLVMLKRMCDSQNLILNYTLEHDPAVFQIQPIDMIFTHKVIGGEMYYYIKWKNCSSEKNSWEPSSNLTGCHDIIQYYHAMKDSKIKSYSKLLNYFVKDLITREPSDILTLTKTCALISGKSENQFKKFKLTVSQMKSYVKEILNFSPKKLHSLRNNLYKIMQFGEARKRVLINLEEWQQEINSKNETAYVEVENNVDLETAPSKFEFIHDYINTVMNIPEEPVAFCKCENCLNEKNTCCPHDSDGQFAYDQHRLLILKPGYPIFECNSKCSCDNNCINRVVQHGQKIKVRIFRTSNGCGWGLKTLENIEKGQFVLEYLGEIITSEAAEARGNIYDYVGRSYLFDLDYGVDSSSCCFTVDAGHVGNASHFINHSCNPNLHVFAVWINQPDPNLPRLAFFAKRKILKGEELTFDYKMVQKDRFGSKNRTADERERILCRCKSKNCRKYLF